MTSISALAQSPEPAKIPPPDLQHPYVILKLDDLTWDSPMFKKVFEYLKGKNIKCSVGIICKSLEGDRQPYYTWIKGINETGLVEFWNHGWDHKNWKEGDKDLYEFCGPSYEQQKEHITRSQQLGKEKLGITFRAFNAGYGKTDENTIKALSEDPDLKIYLYGQEAWKPQLPNMLVMVRLDINIENPTFKPNLERLKSDYKHLLGTQDCFMIQGHPNNWDEPRFVEFTQQVEFLESQGARFVTPSEYYEVKKAGK